MSSVNILPNEATTEFIAHQELQTNTSLQVFFESLDSDQQRRFIENAHHLVYLGFEQGLRRPMPLTEDIQAKVLVREAELYSMGAGERAEPKTEFEGN